MLCKVTNTQDTFRPIPGLISCTRVSGGWRLLSHAQNAVRWLALSKQSVEAPLKHHLFVQLSLHAGVFLHSKIVCT